jgi:hypothetical protein
MVLDASGLGGFSRLALTHPGIDRLSYTWDCHRPIFCHELQGVHNKLASDLRDNVSVGSATPDRDSAHLL